MNVLITSNHAEFIAFLQTKKDGATMESMPIDTVRSLTTNPTDTPYGILNPRVMFYVAGTNQVLNYASRQLSAEPVKYFIAAETRDPLEQPASFVDTKTLNEKIVTSVLASVMSGLDWSVDLSKFIFLDHVELKFKSSVHSAGNLQLINFEVRLPIRPGSVTPLIQSLKTARNLNKYIEFGLVDDVSFVSKPLEDFVIPSRNNPPVNSN